MIDQDLIRQLNRLQKQVDNLVKPEVPPFSVTPFSGYNPIINGAFAIDQRVGPHTSVANGAYTLDRWQYQKSGTMVHDVSQQTNGSPSASLPFINYILVDCTTADPTIAAGDFCTITYKIEGYDWFPFAIIDGFWLMFWAWTPVQGTYCVSVQNSGSDRSCVAEFSGTAGGWGYHEIFFPSSPIAGTWNYTNGIGLAIRWCLAAGSTYQTTADAWQAGNFLATSNQINAVGLTTNNFQLANVKLSKKPTDFTAPSFQQELARAQRYYWQYGPGSGYSYASGYILNTTTARFLIPAPVEMRDTPTVTATGTFLVRGGGASQTVTSFSGELWTSGGIRLNANVASGLTANEGASIVASGGATLAFSAEL